MKLTLGLGLSPAAVPATLRPRLAWNTENGDTIPASPVAASLLSYGGRGAVYIRWTDPDPRPASSGYQTLFVLSDGTNNNRFEVTKQLTNGDLLFRVVSGGVTQLSFDWTSQAIVPGKTNILMLALKPGAVSVTLNGIRIGWRDSGVTLPASISSGLSLGRNHAGGNVFSGSLVEARWYNQCPSLTQAKALTDCVDIASASFDAGRDFIAFMGQSNSVGQGEGADYPAAYKNDIKLLGKNMASGMVDYADPYAAGTATFGGLLQTTSNGFSYAGVACDHIAQETGRVTVAVPVNQGGSGLVSPANWRAHLTGAQGETIFNSRLYAAIQTLRHAKKLGVLKAVVWHQGETDAASNVSGGDYSAALLELYTQIRVYAGNVPVITVSLHNTPGASPGTWVDVRAAQDAISFSNHRVVPSLGAPTLAGDDIHLSSMGLYEMGFKIATAILKQCGDIAEGDAIDPIIDTVPGLRDYWIADASFMTLTGADIDSWAGAVRAVSLAAGTHKLAFESDAFGVGKDGAAVATGRGDSFMSVSIANRATHTIIAGFYIPDMAAEKTLLNFSNNSQAKLRVNASEQIGWRGTQAAPTTTAVISPASYGGVPVVAVLRFASTSLLESWFNGTAENGTSIDPSDTYSNQTVLRVMGGAAGEAAIGAKARVIMHFERALSDWIIAEMIRKAAQETGVSL